MAKLRTYPEGTTQADRQRAYRDRIRAREGRPVRFVLPPEAVAVVDAAKRPGEDDGATIARLLLTLRTDR